MRMQLDTLGCINLFIFERLVLPVVGPVWSLPLLLTISVSSISTGQKPNNTTLNQFGLVINGTDYIHNWIIVKERRDCSQIDGIVRVFHYATPIKHIPSRVGVFRRDIVSNL